MDKTSIVFYKDWFDAISELTDEERLDIYEAVFRYAFYGEAPQDRFIKAVTSLMRSAIDMNSEKYKEICERNRINGRKGGRPRNSDGFSKTQKTQMVFQKPKKAENDNDNDIKKKDISSDISKKENSTQKFIPPTIEEVDEYIQSKGYTVDADMFWNFYESKGWMIGKNKMKNWRAAVATWQKTETERENGNNKIQSENRRGSLEVTASGEEDYSTTF